jgi:hypothetical protein
MVNSVEVEVAAPWRIGDLVRRLVRVRHANAAMRDARPTGAVPMNVRAPDRFAWFRDVVLPHPWLGPSGAVYATISLIAGVLAWRDRSRATAWGRDESTRDPSKVQKR